MSGFQQNPSYPKSKSALLFTLIVSATLLTAGCDSQEPSSDGDVALQTENADKNLTNNDSAPSDSTTVPNSDTANDNPKPSASEVSADNAVSPSGYQKLSFGQTITPELLEGAGLTRPDNYNEQCYYVSDPKLNYTDKDTGERPSMLYQIMDGKLALITVRDGAVPFYTGINVGSSVGDVMLAHQDNLAYQVDKYTVEGDYYDLISNVNFKTIKDVKSGVLLTNNDIKLDNSDDKLALQIKYNMKGGAKLNSNMIKATEWTAENKALLKGEVESIDIGVPEAIYLVEGCS